MDCYYRKCTHSEARSRFIKGKEIVMCSKQFIPNDMWHPQCHITGYDKSLTAYCTYTAEQAWDAVKNSFNYYNCYDGDDHYGIDYYVAVYPKEEK